MNPLDYQKIPALLLAHHSLHKKDLPWRKDKDPYHIWISEIMLQQTRIETVIPYYLRFIERLPTIQSLATVAEDELLKLWEGLGYYSRARNLQKSAKIIVEKFDGVFPHCIDDILSLKGVGPYTAGAIASIAFNQKQPAIDGNVFRVFSRLSQEKRAIDDVNYKKELHQLLKDIYPEEAGDFTEALMELGETICLPNTDPLCSCCPLSSLCQSYQHHSQRQYPVVIKKTKLTIEERSVFIFEYQGKYALQKRKDSGLLASMYQFPNCLAAEHNDFLRKHAVSSVKETLSYKHIFSHIHWLNTVYYVPLSQTYETYDWFSSEEIKKVAIPSAFQKILPLLKIK